MKVKIEETREKMIDHGFGVLEPCTLTEPRKCITGSYIGGYHTHPRTGTKPSITDLIAAYNQDIECIGFGWTCNSSS